MTITREQIDDLRVGDVVEFRNDEHPLVYVHGPITRHDGDVIFLGIFAFTSSLGATLTVIERAPRPLYVNHDRTEPVPGDVVRNADSGDSSAVWLCDSEGDWWSPTERTVRMWEREYLPDRLRLLVDGTTGQVVL